MRVKVTTRYVDDHEKALRLYTEVLGFVKKTDVSQGPYRGRAMRAVWRQGRQAGHLRGGRRGVVASCSCPRSSVDRAQVS